MNEYLKATLLAAVVAVFPGCAGTEGAGSGTESNFLPCETTADCPTGTCVRGRCRGGDAGARPDGGRPEGSTPPLAPDAAPDGRWDADAVSDATIDAVTDAVPDVPSVVDGAESGTDAAAPDSGPASTLRSALLGAWSLDGDGQDHSGNGAHLELAGYQLVAGQFGQGLRIEYGDSGLPARVESGAAADRLATGVGVGDFTVATWVQVLEPRERFWVLVQGVGEGSGYPGWAVGTSGSGWVFGHSTMDMVVGGPFAELDRFHHLLMTRSGPTLRMFVDGVEVETAEQAWGEAPPLTFALLLGVGPTPDVNGIIDDIAIWDRTLTDDERAYLLTRPVPTR